MAATDPTFYRSPGAAVSGAPEQLAYVVAFDPAGQPVVLALQLRRPLGPAGVQFPVVAAVARVLAQPGPQPGDLYVVAAVAHPGRSDMGVPPGEFVEPGGECLT